MVPDADDLLAQQLLQLRREYLADSVKRVEELRALQAALAGDQQTVLVRLRQAFHKLAGSGGSYGFPAVSSRSREGEAMIQRLESAAVPLTDADRAAIEACVTSIDRAFADARSSMEASQ
jgi:chemotaxis protein histidine kinase CheA